MRFGQVRIIMNIKIFLPVVLFVSMLFLISCGEDSAGSDIGFKFPEQGQAFGLGEEVKVELKISKNAKVTSVTYAIDGKILGSVPGPSAFSFKTAGLSLGYKLITAVVDNGEKKDTLSVNVEFRSRIKPANLKYEVVKTYPHDTSSYTEGLAYHDGRLLESTGERGNSRLRWVDLQTGKPIVDTEIDKQYFGEGSVLLGEKIVMLTYTEHLGFVFDAKTLKQLSTFPASGAREGWGLAFDGKHILNSDGSNRIYFLNKDTYQDEGFIEVYDNKGQVNQLNELEYIDGKIYANIYTTDNIAIIDPVSGAVESYINMKGILPTKDRAANTDVLNGIAWDKQGKRLFVTGKKWPKLFEVQLISSDKTN